MAGLLRDFQADLIEQPDGQAKHLTPEAHAIIEAKDLTCVVCFEVLHDMLSPMAVACCGKYVCTPCMVRVGGAGHTCPACTKVISKVAEAFLQQHVNGLPMVCGACDKTTLTWGAWRRHRIEECPKQLGRCTRCNRWGLRHDEMDHVTECPHRTVECSDCKATMWFSEQPYHGTRCPERIVGCPLCSKALASRLVAAHQEHDCLEVWVECPYAPAGCTVRPRRAGLDEHLASSTPAHMKAMLQTIQRLDAELIAVKAACSEMAKEMATIKGAAQHHNQHQHQNQDKADAKNTPSSSKGTVRLDALGTRGPGPLDTPLVKFDPRNTLMKQRGIGAHIRRYQLFLVDEQTLPRMVVAQDFQGDFFLGEVVERKQDQVRVHYENFTVNSDEWISVHTARFRAVTEMVRNDFLARFAFEPAAPSKDLMSRAAIGTWTKTLRVGDTVDVFLHKQWTTNGFARWVQATVKTRFELALAVQPLDWECDVIHVPLPPSDVYGIFILPFGSVTVNATLT